MCAHTPSHAHTHTHTHTHTHIVGYNPFGSDSDEDESGSGISSSQPPASYGYHVSPLPKSPTNQGSAELLNRASLHGTDSSGGSARNSPLMKGTCNKLQFVFFLKHFISTHTYYLVNHVQSSMSYVCFLYSCILHFFICYLNLTASCAPHTILVNFLWRSSQPGHAHSPSTTLCE